MAQVIASYQLATFTSPTDGDSPISATTVKGNDNTIRGAYNSHDADPGIHLQSSTLAARPAAATVGRKWLTNDGFRVYYDDGSNWQEIQYLSLAAGGTVAGATTFSSTVGVTGAVTLSSTLAVTGLATGSTGFAVVKNGSDTAESGPYLQVGNAAGSRKYTWQLGDTANDRLKLFAWNGTSSTEIFSVNTAGAATFPGAVTLSSTLAVAELLTASKGIVFPATQVASADANTLDDYEEGTWTPVLAFGGASVGITYSTQSGRYVKVGKTVFASFRITLSAKGSSTGAASITGLPFTVQNDLGATAPGGLRGSNLTFTGIPNLAAVGDTTTATFQMFASGGSAADISDTGFAANTTIIATIVYEAAA